MKQDPRLATGGKGAAQSRKENCEDYKNTGKPSKKHARPCDYSGKRTGRVFLPKRTKKREKEGT